MLLMNLLIHVHVLQSVWGRINFINISKTDFALAHSYFPNRPPKRTKVRVDIGGQEVKTGRLDLLGGISDFVANRHGKWDIDRTKKVTFTEFKKILQCAPREPGLNQAHGTLGILSLYPLGSEVIETAAVLADTTTKPDHHNCIDVHGKTNWRTCLNHAREFKENRAAKDRMKDMNTNVRLVRLINGRLYFDWPWKLPESSEHSTIRSEFDSQWSFLRLLGGALEKISDLSNCVFLTITFDYPFLPSFFPMPALSNAPKVSNSELPYPFTLLLNDEIQYYYNYVTKISKKGQKVEDLHEDVMKNNGFGKELSPDDDELWSSRLEKAAFFGGLFFSPMSTSRQIVIDLSIKHPDLIVANFSKEVGASYHHPYVFRNSNKQYANTDKAYDAYLDSVSSRRQSSNVPLVEGYMAKYKYLLVLGGISVSERLATFLAHSGAVVLLQETEVQYFFSARLKPWVHYVPLSYTASDVVEKIRWLKRNDHIAREIARNGKTFGRSYLRLEDYYCYAAQALHSFGRVMTDEALKPFSKDLTIIPPI